MLPLANKLDETGVFGGFVGKQFATTVLANRDRWVKKGQKVTDQIIEEGKKMTIDNATMCNPCRMDDEADRDLDPESGEMETSNEPDEAGSPTDWVKVVMFVVIVLLLGVILQLSQIRRHPKTPPKGNPGVWKINCRKLGKAISPMGLCKDGYLRIDNGGHATFHLHVSDDCNESELNGCFRNAPILMQQDLMKIGLSTLPFEEEHVAVA